MANFPEKLSAPKEGTPERDGYNRFVLGVSAVGILIILAVYFFSK